MDEEPRVCQSEGFVELEIPDFGSCDVEDEEEDWIEDSFHVVGKTVGIAEAVVQGFGGFGFVERGIGWYWTRKAYVGRATEHCKIVLGSANRFEGELELVEVEEVGLDRHLDMQLAKHRGRSVRCNLVKGVCLVRLGEDCETLDSPALEEPVLG